MENQLQEVNSPIVPNAERGKIAKKLEDDLIILKRRMGRNFLQMGKLLKIIRDNEYYRELGYDTVSEWLSSPEVSISASWAWNFISIYEVFIERHNLSPERLLESSYNKLVQIIPVIRKHPDQLEDWLNKAESLRRIDLQKEIKEHKIEERLEQVPEERKNPSEPTLIHGEVIEEMEQLENGVIDLVLTTPPLADTENPTPDDILSFQRSWLKEAFRVLDDNGMMLVIGDYHNIFSIGYEMERLGMSIVRDIVWSQPYSKRPVDVYSLVPVHDVILWSKKGEKHSYNFTHVERDVWELPNATKTDYPLDKPPLLLSKLIKMTTDEGSMILDPFAGAGSALLEAKKLNRNYIGIERDESWYQVAVRRLSEVNQN